VSLEVVVGLALMAKTESGVAGRMVDLESCLDNNVVSRNSSPIKGPQSISNSISQVLQT
jgi:hypothetical protein